jgi:citrate synthase
MKKDLTAVKEVKPESAFHEGLEDVIAAESSICLIDGKASKLFYRGYDIHQLANGSNFEETAYLLLNGELPKKAELESFRASLAAERDLPREVVELMASFPKDAHPMAVLRTAVSVLAFYDKEAEDKTEGANFRKAIRIIAKMPALVAAFDRIRRGQALVAPMKEASWSTARNFLYMLRGKEASPVENQMLDKYFVLLAEHDLNASTFTARVAASTQSDIYSAISAAVGTLKGDLHGSANTRTMEALLKIGSTDKVESFVDDALANKKKIMGFGHRMYKGPDPRAKDLHEMARALAENNAEQAKWYAISEKLEKTVFDRKKLSANVDFYSASVLYTLGIPVDMFTPMFAVSRSAGWSAHVLEQSKNNRLIRPASLYTGPSERAYVPIDRR